MIRPKEDSKPIIDLSATQGNAFYLLGQVKSLHKEITKNGIELPRIEDIEKEMKEGDYDHLIKTFDKYFGEYIDLVY